MGRAVTLLVVVALALSSNAEDVMPEGEGFDALDTVEELTQMAESSGASILLTLPARRMVA